jgi:hypothetical protein
MASPINQWKLQMTAPTTFQRYLTNCSPVQLRQLKAAAPALKAEAVKQHVNDLCSQWVLSHNAGPMYWLRKWTRTFNFQWERDHQQPEAPFPYRPFADRKIDLRSLPFPHDFTAADPPDYIDILMGFLMFTKDIAKHDELWIPKSREMMTSWTVVGYITWHCQFRPQIEWILQSEDDLKAMGNIKYANALYTNQPQWMKQMHPLHSGEEGSSHKVEWATGSLIRALPSGIRKFASSHAHGYMSDETAHQAGAEATINIVKPADPAPENWTI